MKPKIRGTRVRDTHFEVIPVAVVTRLPGIQPLEDRFPMAVPAPTPKTAPKKREP
jgi:hypothetical protein